MTNLTAKELQAQDPKRFQREYLEWTNYALDYDWWDYMEEAFKNDMADKGVSVSRIYFTLSYSQGDYASFEGGISVDEWMAHKGYDETYPALYLAALDYGEFAQVSERSSRGSWPRVSLDGNLAGNTDPTGIFKHLDREAWDELVYEQFSAAGLEDEMQSFVEDECRQLYRDLREEYEHLTSEQSFIESCECNDITFEIEECIA
jgi:hypothetical protein